MVTEVEHWSLLQHFSNTDKVVKDEKLKGSYVTFTARELLQHGSLYNLGSARSPEP